jgi:hypothetical protein
MKSKGRAKSGGRFAMLRGRVEGAIRGLGGKQGRKAKGKGRKAKGSVRTKRGARTK